MSSPARPRRLGAYLRPPDSLLGPLAVALAAMTVLPLVGPMLVSRFVDGAVAGRSTAALLALAGAYLATAVGAQGARLLASLLASRAAWDGTNRLREAVADHTLRLDLDFHARHTPGEMIERVDGDVAALGDFLVAFLLGFIGFNINKFSIHRKNKVRTRISLWTRWADFVQRRPIPIAVIGFVVLAAASVPVFGLRLGMADAGNNPEGSTTKTAYDLTAQGFGPGANGRMLIVADTSEGSPAGLAGVVDTLRKVPGVVMVTDFMPAPDGGKAAIATLIASTGPQDLATESLVHHLRNDVVPAAEAATGLQVHIGGTTALGMDFATKISQRLPIFIGAVLLLSFLLLLMVFRSVVVPLKAVVMNLLSIGAAYGVMVAVFQWGWFGSIVGVTGAPIEAWAPMMLFAIVFGLSMDYEVFLLSAVKEEYDATGDNAHAVATGLAVTGRLITAAGLIMVLVFGSFVLMDMRAMKLMGLGLAVAVAIDATIVRIVLVPATMELLGKANWWLPSWLDRILPHLAVEGSPSHTPAPVPAPVPASAPAGRQEDEGDTDSERIGAGQH